MTTMEEVLKALVLETLFSLARRSLGVLWATAERMIGVLGIGYFAFYYGALVKRSKNRYYWAVVLTGVLMNLLAILANGLQMPVFGRRNLDESGMHKKGSGKTRLKFLTDIYHGAGGNIVFSTGDVFIEVGLLILTVKAAVEELQRTLRNKADEWQYWGGKIWFHKMPK